MWVNFLIVLWAGLLWACSAQSSTPVELPSVTPTFHWQGSFAPYKTSTATPTRAAPTPLPEIPLTPAPTATPFTHIVVKDDSLLGIAIKYGVTLEDLKAANPDVDARMLSIGQVLIIPLATGQETALPLTPTPVQVRLESVKCYPVADGSLACLVEALNDQPEALENLMVWFGLYSQDGSLQNSQIGIPPINILSSGGRMPVVVYFPPPLPEELVARAELVSAMAVGDLKSRYVSVDNITKEAQVSADGLSANVHGQIVFSAPASRVKGAAVAYDATGGVVGMRVWKADTPCQAATPESTQTDATPTPATPQPCGPLPYNITVYSLGPQIARIEILIEARP